MIFGFIVLLSSLTRLADLTKYLFLNDKPCMVRTAIIDMNLVELKYYPFMISLNKYTGSCNVLAPKVFVPKETKDMNVKTFNTITNNDEGKAMTEQISCDFKCKVNSTTCNSNQKWDNKTCQCECKDYHDCEKIIVGIQTRVFVRMVST